MLDIRRILAPWGRGAIKDALTMNGKLVRNGLTWEHIDAWLKEVKKTNRKPPIKPMLCPDCNHPMTLYHVDEDFCHWTCPKCRKGIPIYHSMEEELKLRRNKDA